MSRLAYPPRLPLPASDVDAAPLAGIFINRAWLGVLLSACERLSTRWGWIEGTDFDRAEQQALTLYLKIANAQGMIGTVHPYVTTTPPPGCLPCDGTIYNRADYSALYDRLPAALIVDSDTFRTPDLRARFIIGATNITYPPLAVGGEASVTLEVSQIPSHTHTTQPHSHTESATSPILVSEAPDPIFPAAIGAAGVTGLETVIVDPTGGGEPHNNLPPYIALNYCIVAL